MNTAIRTKKIAATNTLGARISATFEEATMTIPYYHGATNRENHADAARALALRLCIAWTHVGARLAEDECVFVSTDDGIEEGSS